MMTRDRRQRPDHGLPAVNLVSPWVFEALATRRLRQRFAAAVVLLVLVLAGGWSLQHLQVTGARQMLAIEQAESGRLAVESQALAPVRGFVTSVEQQKKTVQDTMAREIYFSVILEGLQRATPSGANVESALVTLNPTPPPPAVVSAPEGSMDSDAPTEPPVPAVSMTPSPCPGPDPFNIRAVVGCITLSGSAANRRAVGDLVIRLGDSALFVEPFISTTTTADGEKVIFTGSVGLSEQVFSNRYADLKRLLEGTSR
jgi:hypothetical protein